MELRGFVRVVSSLQIWLLYLAYFCYLAYLLNVQVVIQVCEMQKQTPLSIAAVFVSFSAFCLL